MLYSKQLSTEYIYSFEEKKFLNDSVQSCEKKKGSPYWISRASSSHKLLIKALHWLIISKFDRLYKNRGFGSL